MHVSSASAAVRPFCVAGSALIASSVCTPLQPWYIHCLHAGTDDARVTPSIRKDLAEHVASRGQSSTAPFTAHHQQTLMMALEQYFDVAVQRAIPGGAEPGVPGVVVVDSWMNALPVHYSAC